MLPLVEATPAATPHTKPASQTLAELVHTPSMLSLVEAISTTSSCTSMTLQRADDRQRQSYVTPSLHIPQQARLQLGPALQACTHTHTSLHTHQPNATQTARFEQNPALGQEVYSDPRRRSRVRLHLHSIENLTLILDVNLASLRCPTTLQLIHLESRRSAFSLVLHSVGPQMNDRRNCLYVRSTCFLLRRRCHECGPSTPALPLIRSL